MSNASHIKNVYEIFRACRLCGAGKGYKMPIMPSVVGFDCPDIELRHKIHECLQIKVQEDDKMPPLICELCADKVNDFYEFLEMCRDTNVKTRQRLGLPEQHSKSPSETGDCILGVIEPVCAYDGDETSQKKSQSTHKVKKGDKKKNRNIRSLKKELETLIRAEEIASRESRSSRGDRDSSSSRSSRLKKSPSPEHARETRQSMKDKDQSLNKLKDQPKKTDVSKTKPGSKKGKEEVIEIEDDDEDGDDIPISRTKRKLERDSSDCNLKRIKLTIKLPTESSPKTTPGPKSSKASAPGPKSSKASIPDPKSSIESTDSTPGLRSSKPGPKSAKDSKPGPKSSKDSTPGPKSSKDSIAGIRSSKDSKPGPKSSKDSTPGPKSSKELKPGPKSSKIPAGKASKAGPEHSCVVCASVFASAQKLSQHLRQHTVTFTDNDLACDPCGEWFASAEDIAAHHKQHKNKPYRCRGCAQSYRQLQAYKQHVSETVCVPWTERAEPKCARCWKSFPTELLLEQHHCAGADARPGGKCSNCDRTYQTQKSLKRHEKFCTVKKKGYLSGARVEPAVRRRLLHAAVRVARCDTLLGKGKRRCNVGHVSPNFGLDRNSIYPYRSFVRVKSEPLHRDGMVSINKEVRDQLYKEEDYVHWDSDNSSSDEEFLLNPGEKKKKVPSLTTLSLKTLFSRRCLGKVPKKLRKVKSNFDSLFNLDTEFNVQDDIDNIINNLGDDNIESESVNSFSLNDIKLSDVHSICDSTLGNDNAGVENDNFVTDNDNSVIDDKISGIDNDNSVIGNDNVTANVDNDTAGIDNDATDIDSAGINKDTAINDGDTNYESDSLLEDQGVVNEENFDFNNESNASIINKHLLNVNVDNGSETDASIEDNNVESQNTKHNYDENETASETSLNIDDKIININYQNGNLSDILTDLTSNGNADFEPGFNEINNEL